MPPVRVCQQYWPPPPHHHDPKPCFDGFTHTVLALNYNPRENHCDFNYVYLRPFPDNRHKFCFGDIFRSDTSVYMHNDMRIVRGPFILFLQPGPMMVSFTPEIFTVSLTVIRWEI